MLGATKALILGDEDEARDVIRVHDDLTVRTVEAEASALQLLVRQEGDLRDVAVSLQTVADVNQMNVLARRVARVALRALPMHALPEDVNGYFSEMGDRADPYAAVVFVPLHSITEAVDATQTGRPPLGEQAFLALADATAEPGVSDGTGLGPTVMRVRRRCRSSPPP